MKARKFPRAKPYRTEAETRAIVRFRDGYCCQECGMTARDHVVLYGKNLEVHRLVQGSRYTLKGCITLCIPCHNAQPKLPRRPKPARKKRPVSKPRQLRLSDETLADLDLIVEMFALQTRSDAIRMAVHRVAIEEGYA